jgi:hypothetical protein
MFVLKIHNKPLLRRQQLQGVFVPEKLGPSGEGEEPALHHGLLLGVVYFSTTT